MLYCYSAGAVSVGGNVLNVSGFLGYLESGYVRYSFWDVETSGAGNVGDSNFGAIGKTTAEMQDIDTFLGAGWDFVGEGGYGNEELWCMPYEMPGYPILAWQRDIAGDVTGGYGVDMADASKLASGWMEEYGIADLEEMAANWLSGK